MDIQLIKTDINDSIEIHTMQIAGFKNLLDKYQDFETNPGAETLKRVQRRFFSKNVDQFFIAIEGKNIGYIRIQHLGNAVFRLSQMFILPEFQDKGYAQKAIKLAESHYPGAEKWELDTIKQEHKLCHLYEKMGYRLTGIERSIKPGMTLVDYAK